MLLEGGGKRSLLHDVTGRLAGRACRTISTPDGFTLALSSLTQLTPAYAAVALLWIIFFRFPTIYYLGYISGYLLSDLFLDLSP